AYRRIILPQVVKHCLPVLCTYATGIVKMSSLAFVFGVPEVTALAKTSASRNLGYVEAYFVIAIFYIALNIGIEWLFKLIERRRRKC
ncbi:MAG: ABC transporter permease subunit, partial [Treponema sp.]|nr:ABC transporter permease subunit [Treponema sp.]